MWPFLSALALALAVTGCSSEGGASPATTPTKGTTPTPASSLPPLAGRFLSALESGQTLRGITGWQVSPRFPDAKGEPVVLYYIDDVLAWRERHEPYRFQGDGAEFDTRHLTNGVHQLRAVATYPSGQQAVWEATVTVANRGPVPVGSYTDYAYSAKVPSTPGVRVSGVPIGGLWLLTFPVRPLVLKLSPPNAEPLELPLRRRTDGSLAVPAPGCATLALSPTSGAGSVTFAATSASTPGCAPWRTLLAERTWQGMPG